MAKKKGSENMKEDTEKKTGTLRNVQKRKTKFRASKEWKDFRRQLKKRHKVDCITLRPLTPRANCHHMDLNPENYTNIADEGKFTMLNKSSHDFTHWGYNVAKRIGLKTFSENYNMILRLMLEINGEEDKIYE